MTLRLLPETFGGAFLARRRHGTIPADKPAERGCLWRLLLNTRNL